MPYKSIADLPASVKDALPSEAEHIFLKAFDAAFAKYNDEEKSFKIAWAAVKNAGFSKNQEGRWTKTDTREEIEKEDPSSCGCEPEDEDCYCDNGEEAIARKKMKNSKRRKKKSYDSVTRYDNVTISSKAKKTSQGFLQVPANLSRIGIFSYRNFDGSSRKELRLPEEVFNTRALATLKSAPVTLDHPKEGMEYVMVNPNNSKKFSVGVLSENIKTDEQFISADIIVMDAEAIKAVENGKKREVSLGYTCDLEMIPGTWNGEKYDAIQRNIVYNHAAIVGRGRAGSDVRIHIDSAETDYPEAETRSEMETLILKLDGADYELPKSTVEAITKEMQNRDIEIASIKAELETTKGKFDALESEFKKATEAKVQAEDTAKFDAAVLARTNLLDQAKKVLGSDEGLKDLTNRQIKEKVLSALNPETKFDTATEDYVNGGFDLVIKNYRERNDSVAAVRKAVEETAKPQAKISNSNDLWKNAWKKPLTK